MSKKTGSNVELMMLHGCYISGVLMEVEWHSYHFITAEWTRLVTSAFTSGPRMSPLWHLGVIKQQANRGMLDTMGVNNVILTDSWHKTTFFALRESSARSSSVLLEWSGLILEECERLEPLLLSRLPSHLFCNFQTLLHRTGLRDRHIYKQVL